MWAPKQGERHQELVQIKHPTGSCPQASNRMNRCPPSWLALGQLVSALRTTLATMHFSWSKTKKSAGGVGQSSATVLHLTSPATSCFQMTHTCMKCTKCSWVIMFICRIGKPGFTAKMFTLDIHFKALFMDYHRKSLPNASWERLRRGLGRFPIPKREAMTTEVQRRNARIPQMAELYRPTRTALPRTGR